MTRIFPALFFLLIISLVGCSSVSKTQFLENYDEFMEEVQEDHEDYSSKDWKKKNESLKTFLEDEYPQFEEDLTKKEKVRIWAQALTYQVYQHKEEVIEEIEKNEEVYVEMIEEHVEFVTEVNEEIIEDVLPELERILPELKEVGKSLIERLEEKGTFEKLEKSFEKLEQKIEELEKKLE